ncbi:hypothetical protein G6011_11262 [Alternaria panax]|uniref:Uncharacterized protein n=1 Tax=Alternaria panax TaxID=48097 RepID=A0AAD4ID62_9PLEO|nr:hypothetical protein G6011_11262 [Alternaria panax]
MLTSADEKDRELYYNSLSLLIQQRHDNGVKKPDALHGVNETFRTMPHGDSLDGGKSSPLSEGNSSALIGNGSTASAGTKSTTPLVRGCPARKSSVSQTLSAAGAVHQNKELAYSLRIRTHLSVGFKEKLLHLVFDLTCTLPNTYDNVDLLVSLEVQRNYEPTRLKTTRAIKITWSFPFPICEVVFNKDIKAKAQDEDGYEYFKNNYNHGKEIKHQHFPPIEDGRGCYFSLTKVRFPEDRYHSSPNTSDKDPWAPSPKAESFRLHAHPDNLEPSNMLEKVGAGEWTESDPLDSLL